MLEGTVYGSNRAELMKSAQDTAAKYFGVPCVSINLTDERPETTQSRGDSVVREVMTFSASFMALEHHPLEQKAARGPMRCKICDRQSWPSDPLPQARWTSYDASML